MGEAFSVQYSDIIFLPYVMPLLTDGSAGPLGDQSKFLKMVDFSASVTDKDKGAST